MISPYVFIVVIVLASLCAFLAAVCLWLDFKLNDARLRLEAAEEVLEFWSKEEDVDGRAV